MFVKGRNSLAAKIACRNKEQGYRTEIDYPRAFPQIVGLSVYFFSIVKLIWCAENYNLHDKKNPLSSLREIVFILLFLLLWGLLHFPHIQATIFVCLEKCTSSSSWAMAVYHGPLLENAHIILQCQSQHGVVG